MLETLASELRQNGSFVRTEDSAFFGSVIPAQALAAVGNDAFRTRPIVVDAVIQLDANSPLQIVEVKTIAYCPSWYSPHGDGPNKRERGLQPEYERMAKALDIKYNLRPAGPQGQGFLPWSAETKLKAYSPIRGIVAGGFGEGSACLHTLLEDIAARGAARMRDRAGMELAPTRARILEHLYRRVGVVVARGLVRTMMDRLGRTHSLHSQHRRANMVLSGMQPVDPIRDIELIEDEEAASRRHLSHA